MPAGRRRVAPWLGSLRLFTKESGRSELAPSEGFDSAKQSIQFVPDTREWEAGPRKRGDIRGLVRRIAENGGNAFRLSVYWGGEVYFQSQVASHAPGLKDLDYLREAMEEGRRSGVQVIAYMNPNCLYDTHRLWEMSSVFQLVGDPSDPDSYKLTRHLNGGVDASFSRWLEPAGPVLVGNAVEWARQGQATCKVHSSAGRFTVRLYDQADCGPIRS
jgi:hypothetical protein